jgi:hypothetical protein
MNKVRYFIPIKIILSGWKMACENQNNHQWLQPRALDANFISAHNFLQVIFMILLCKKIVILIGRR